MKKFSASLNDIFLEIDRLSTIDKNHIIKEQKNKSDKTKKKEDVYFFDFPGYGKIPYARGTRLFYLDDLGGVDTGKILGIKNKDEYGYYDEIFVSAYDDKVRRYYPTNDWSDWLYLKNNKIPFSFITPDDRQFHLILKLIEPNKSVTKYDDPNNKSRGWALSFPGSSTDDVSDSKTGYYRTDGGVEIPYNVTKEMIPGDLSTMDIDVRTSFDKFMDSGYGTLAQIGIAIAVAGVSRGITARYFISPQLISQGGTAAVRSRLFVATLIGEAIQGVGFAAYYFNREDEGSETMGWLSLAFMAFPFISRYVPGIRGIMGEFSKEACLEISEKVMLNHAKGFTSYASFLAFTDSLSLEAKALVLRAVKNNQKLKNLLPNISNAVERNLPLSQSQEFLRVKALLEQTMTKPKPNFLISLSVELGTAVVYFKFADYLIKSYMNYKNRVTKSTDKTKEEVLENLKKVDKQISKMSAWEQYTTNEKLAESPMFEFTDKMIQDMCENGIITEDLQNKLKQFAKEEAKTELNALLRKEQEKEDIEFKKDIKMYQGLFDYVHSGMNKDILNNFTPEQKKILDEVYAEINAESKPTETDVPPTDQTVTKTDDDANVEQKLVTNEKLYQYYNTKENRWITIPDETQLERRKILKYEVRTLLYDKEKQQWYDEEKKEVVQLAN